MTMLEYEPPTLKFNAVDNKSIFGSHKLKVNNLSWIKLKEFKETGLYSNS